MDCTQCRVLVERSCPPCLPWDVLAVLADRHGCWRRPLDSFIPRRAGPPASHSPGHRDWHAIPSVFTSQFSASPRELENTVQCVKLCHHERISRPTRELSRNHYEVKRAVWGRTPKWRGRSAPVTLFRQNPAAWVKITSFIGWKADIIFIRG